MEKNYSISVIVPFFNEDNYLEESVNRLIEVGVFKEIILVDNKSTDKSNFIANSFVKSHKNIFLIKAFEKSGKGYAVSVGLKYATSTHLIIHDADLEYFPEDILDMFKLTQKYPNDLILGSRVIGDKVRQNKYYYTRLFNRLFSLFFSLINFYKVTDISSCYQINKLSNLIDMELVEPGFAIEVEILSKNLRMNNKIIETPIKYKARSYSEGKKIKVYDAAIIFFKILNYSRLNFFFK